MATISGVKTIGSERVLISLELAQKELLRLGGNMQDMHIFSEANLNYESRIVQRGKRDSSKYFLMPKELREDLVVNCKVKCSRIDTKNKMIFIFAMDKINSFN